MTFGSELAVLFNNNLTNQDGIWYSNASQKISYPEEGNDLCFDLEDNSFWFKHRNQLIELLVKRYSGKKAFLDVGGGNGFVAKGLQDAGIETYLVEPGQQGVLNAQTRGVKNLICASLHDLKFLANRIPAIGVFDVVEHIENDLDFLIQLNDKLQQNGHLYVTVPAYRALWSDEDVLAGHFHRYRLKEINAKLSLAGFKIVYSSYIFHFLPIPIFLMRSLPNRLNYRTEVVDKSRHKANHNQNSPVINWLLYLERSAVSKGLRIPFGSSCLVVAVKK